MKTMVTDLEQTLKRAPHLQEVLQNEDLIRRLEDLVSEPLVFYENLSLLFRNADFSGLDPHTNEVKNDFEELRDFFLRVYHHFYAKQP